MICLLFENILLLYRRIQEPYPRLKGFVMKQLFYLIVSIIFFSASVKAQYNLGVATGNWSGANALYLNPANIADSRERFSIEILSVNAGLDNSLGTIKNSSGLFGVVNDGNTNNIFNYSSDNKFSMTAPYAQVHLPGIIVSINHKHSVALTTGIKGFNQFNNFDRSLYRTLTDSTFAPNGNLDLTSSRFNYTAHVWTEVGLSYAGVILDRKEHELKVGITLRYLGGIGYLGLKGYNLNAHYKSGGNDTLFVDHSDLEFASNIVSTKSAILNGISNHNILNDFFGSKEGSGIGADFGLIYDYMPEYSRTGYEADRKTKLTDYSKNRYLLRISASVMDIGAITYSSAHNSNANVTGNGTISGSDFSKNVSNFNEFRSYAVAHGFTADTGHKNTNVYMPTTLRMGADYHAWKWLYINATYIANIANRQNFGNSYYNQITVTPRYDTRFMSIGMPITYSALAQNMKVGVGVRVKGLFIGSDDMIGIVAGHQSGFNIYAGGFIAFNKHKPSGYWGNERSDTTDLEPEPDMENGGSPDTSDQAFVLPRKIKEMQPAFGITQTNTDNAPADRKEYIHDAMELEKK